MTLVSLGCVTALFVKHVSTSYSGTIPMMVTFIPVVVHILFVRDIYVKWEDRWVFGSDRTGLLAVRQACEQNHLVVIRSARVLTKCVALPSDPRHAHRRRECMRLPD